MDISRYSISTHPLAENYSCDKINEIKKISTLIVCGISGVKKISSGNRKGNRIRPEIQR
jgi:formylmethanofuran:tetrahydromethanopterin formyltransferase